MLWKIVLAEYVWHIVRNNDIRSCSVVFEIAKKCTVSVSRGTVCNAELPILSCLLTQEFQLFLRTSCRNAHFIYRSKFTDKSRLETDHHFNYNSFFLPWKFFYQPIPLNDQFTQKLSQYLLAVFSSTFGRDGIIKIVHQLFKRVLYHKIFHRPRK